MKLRKIELNGKSYDIVCAEVFSTNDELRANIMFEVAEDEAFKLSGTYDEFRIKGEFFNMDTLEIDSSTFGKLVVDVNYTNCTVARAFIQAG